MKSTRNAAILAFATLLIIAGYFGSTWLISGSPMAVENAAGYPAVWSEHQMPELSDAIVKSRGHVELEQGVRFELSSDRSIEEIREFYESEFGSKEWEFESSGDPSNFSYFNEFYRDGLRVTISAMPDPHNMERSNVRLMLHGGSRSDQRPTHSVTTVN